MNLRLPSDQLLASAWPAMAECIERLAGPSIPTVHVRIVHPDEQRRETRARNDKRRRKIVHLIRAGYEIENIAERFGLRVNEVADIAGIRVRRGRK